MYYSYQLSRGSLLISLDHRKNLLEKYKKKIQNSK